MSAIADIFFIPYSFFNNSSTNGSISSMNSLSLSNPCSRIISITRSALFFFSLIFFNCFSSNMLRSIGCSCCVIRLR